MLLPVTYEAIICSATAGLQCHYVSIFSSKENVTNLEFLTEKKYYDVVSGLTFLLTSDDLGQRKFKVR